MPHAFSTTRIARFDQPNATSDGGAILLKAAVRRLGLIERLAACVPDSRQLGMIAQRVFGLACGDPDCNDAARLVEDRDCLGVLSDDQSLGDVDHRPHHGCP